MMKLWSRVCFLVLVISRTSRGENVTETPSTSSNVAGTSSPTDDSHKAEVPSSAGATVVPTPAQTNTTVLSPAEPTEAKAAGEEGDMSNSTMGASNSTVAPATSPGAAQANATSAGIATVPTTTRSTSLLAEETSPRTSWGYVLLVLIIIVIIVLCVILYLLRRVSRTYSFDLQRPAPSRLNEPSGTFELVYVDDLDRPVAKDEIPIIDLSPRPVANGTSLPAEDKGANGETGTTAPQEQPDGADVEPPPEGSASPTPAEGSADQAPSPSTSASLFFDALGDEQQNENNNNPSVCSSDPFVEISLEEPALSDQLLAPAEATSSVLPFSLSFPSASS